MSDPIKSRTSAVFRYTVLKLFFITIFVAALLQTTLLWGRASLERFPIPNPHPSLPPDEPVPRNRWSWETTFTGPCCKLYWTPIPISNKYVTVPVTYMYPYTVPVFLHFYNGKFKVPSTVRHTRGTDTHAAHTRHRHAHEADTHAVSWYLFKICVLLQQHDTNRSSNISRILLGCIFHSSRPFSSIISCLIQPNFLDFGNINFCPTSTIHLRLWHQCS